MQVSRTWRAFRNTPKALSLQSAWVLSTTCVSLMALHTLGHFWGGRVLVRGGFWHHVIFVFSCLFSFLIPPYSPVCGRVWLMALWQRWSIIHHQGGWHEYALWDKFLSATRHKLDSYSFRSIIFDKFERNDFALKHTCQTCKTYWVKQDLCKYSSCKFWNARSWMSRKCAKVKF